MVILPLRVQFISRSGFVGEVSFVRSLSQFVRCAADVRIANYASISFSFLHTMSHSQSLYLSLSHISRNWVNFMRWDFKTWEFISADPTHFICCRQDTFSIRERERERDKSVWKWERKRVRESKRECMWMCNRNFREWECLCGWVCKREEMYLFVCIFVTMYWAEK